MQRMRGVEATTTLVGLEWLKSVRRNGRVVQRAPAGYGFPLESLFIEPREYARYVEAAERAAIRSVTGGTAILSRSASRLRGVGAPLRLRLEGDTTRVRAVVPDRATQGYEILRPRGSAPPESLRTILIRADRDIPARRIRRWVRRNVPAERRVQTASRRQTRYLRYATDSVRSYVSLKRRFGEFAARPVPGSLHLELDGEWVGRNISTQRVAILGNVACHRGLFRQLGGAMNELRRKGLSHLIDPGDYAGCYSPRFVATAPGIRISRHTWGVALDVNARSNPFGAKPRLDARVVRVMERWGFAWGGRWLIPDGMHFEWFEDP